MVLHDSAEGHLEAGFTHEQHSEDTCAPSSTHRISFLFMLHRAALACFIKIACANCIQQRLQNSRIQVPVKL